MFIATRTLRLLVVTVCLNTPLVQAMVDIRGIDLQYRDSRHIELILHAAKPFTYKTFHLPASKKNNKPRRFIIDTFNAAPSFQLDDDFDRRLQKFPLLKKIRIGINKVRNNQKFSRFVLDLTSKTNIHVIPSSLDKNFQLIIELREKSNAVTKKTVQKKRGKTKPPPVKVAQPKTRRIERQNVVINKVANPAINVLTKTKQPRQTANQIKVMIDPGHGGRDPGSVSSDKQVLEKHITFSIAKKLQSLLLANQHFTPLLTREGDSMPSLKNRLKQVHQKEADIFISIHADSFPLGKNVRGASVYTLSSKKSSNQIARLLARAENSVDQRYGLGNLDNLENNEAKYIVRDLQVKSIASASKKLAASVIKSLSLVRPIFNHDIHEGPFYVLRSAYTPSVLVEVGFLSNDDEAHDLSLNNQQILIAEAIYQGILEYANNHMISLGEALKNKSKFTIEPKTQAKPSQKLTNQPAPKKTASELLKKLKMPDSKKRRHKVIAGETFFSIGRQYKVTEKDLIQANAKYQGIIFPGDILIIPQR